MEANRIFQDNLDIKLIPGIRFCRLKLYGIYFLLWNIVLLPFVLLFHFFLAKLDCHVAILLAIVFTLLFFGTYKIFEERLKRRMAKEVIERAWQKYLGAFPFEKYGEKVAQIYKEALEKDIPKNRIEQFIIEKLVES
jgi:hypothetical protein